MFEFGTTAVAPSARHVACTGLVQRFQSRTPAVDPHFRRNMADVEQMSDLLRQVQGQMQTQGQAVWLPISVVSGTTAFALNAQLGCTFLRRRSRLCWWLCP